MMNMGGGNGTMGGMMDCDAQPIPERQGNWQGHVFPGSIFIIWAIHWMVSASWRHLMAVRNGRSYSTRSSEGLLPMIPALNGFNRYPVESILKLVGGLALFILQITYGGYKELVCTYGMRDGRLVTQHLNSWSHASMNLGFALSGLVDLVGHRISLPEGTGMVSLSLGFFIEAMLFSMHEKNGALDQTIHYLLGHSAWAGAVFALLEACFPGAFLLTVGRAYAQLLQGTWFIQSASVLFGGHMAWDDSFMGGEDEAPAMFLPLVYSYHMLGNFLALLAVYLVVDTVYRRRFPEQEHGPPPARDADDMPVHEGSRLLSGEDGYDHAHHRHAHKMVPLASMR